MSANRRQFLRTLIGGIVAAPAITKVLASLPEKDFSICGTTTGRWSGMKFNPNNYHGELEWHNCPDGFVSTVDDHPIRYSITKFHDPGI